MRFIHLRSTLEQGSGGILRATMALAPPIVALGLQWLLWPVIHPYSWFLFYPAVFISSWIGGYVGGLLATTLSTGLVWWFFVSPEQTFLKDELRDFFAAGVFFSMGILFAVFNGWLRKANRQAAQALQVARTANEELQQANLKIQQLYERTKEVDELKSQFFANVSHELRTPLALILGPVERLLASSETNDKTGNDLRVVQRNARTLLGYVDDLLDASKLEAGQTKIEYADIDLVRVVRFVASHFEVLAQERNMAYTVEVPDALQAQLDPAKLRRVLLNLLSNAFKFTPENGVIRLTLRAEEGRAILEVADSGPGIPVEKRAAAFERFRQLDGGATRHFGGTGLGLAIARDFVALQGGTLSVADAPEGGALFIMNLPRLAPAGAVVTTFAADATESEAVQQAVEELRAPRNGFRSTGSRQDKSGLVLVVEDNPDMNRFICECLGDEFRVETAFNGEEGLNKALIQKPDLILSDMMMPGMSGEQLVHAIRAHTELDDTAIVLLTAKGDDALRARMLREGAQDYLTKPFSVEELRARIGGLVARKAAESALRRIEEQFRQLIEQAPDGIFIADLDGRYTEVNSAGCRMLGYRRDELVGKTIMDLIPAADCDRLRQSKEQLFGGAIEIAEWSLRHKNGAYVPVEVSTNILPGGRHLAFVRDISERKRIESALQESHAGLDHAQEMAKIGSWRLDIRRDELRWSDQTYRIFGVPKGAPVSYDTFLSAVHADDREYVDLKWAAAMRGEPCDIEYRIVVDGKVKWVRDRVELEFDNNKTLLRAIGTLQDITEIRQVQERLRQAAIVFDSANDSIMLTDATTKIITVNRAFETITGYRFDEIVGKTPRFLQSGHQGREFYSQMWAALTHSGGWRGEIWNRHKDGEIYPAWENISVVKDDLGHITHYVSVLSDISAIKQAEERLSHLAHHDVLTGLPNRLLYRASLEKSLEQAKRHRRRVALLFLDLDRFKTVNDTLGHAAGDRLLQEIGVRLRRCVRAEDLVARLGGDEFTVILEEISCVDDAAHLAKKISDAIIQPIMLENKEMVVSASIGISLFPDDADNAEDLSRNADAAMYRAKDQGRNTFCFYTAEINSQAMERLSLESSLRRAIDQGELMLYYQPQIDIASGATVGLEALIRWQHPERGFILPAQFIAVAEESGLIVTIGNWVMRQACVQARTWIAAGLQPPRIAINVSGRQILHDDMFESVRSALHDSGLQPGDVQIELEITETVLQSVQSMVRNTDMLQQLRSLGVLIAIDDFGTGYSSLSRLKHLPIDTLKIDGLFVHNIPDDMNDKAITAAIISMGHSLGMRVIAEGVETAAQLAFLREQSCDEVQGFFLGKPVSAEVMTHSLRECAHKKEFNKEYNKERALTGL